MKTGINFKGTFKLEHIRDGKVIGNYEFKNGVVDVGIDSILGIQFHNDTQIAAWYLGLINDAVIGDLAAADTMASHPGWTEDQTYTEAVRQAWGPDAAASKEITNSSFVVFNINGTTTISGLFLTSDSAKGGSTGTLWATGLFLDGNVSAVASDTLNITYTVSGAAG